MSSKDVLKIVLNIHAIHCLELLKRRRLIHNPSFHTTHHRTLIPIRKTPHTAFF
jgi:hypothetical protein